MRPRHRAATGPGRPDPGRTGGRALIGLISLVILGLSSLFVSATNLTSDLARGAIAVAALSLALLAATAFAVLLLTPFPTFFPHRSTRPTWPPTPAHHAGRRHAE